MRGEQRRRGGANGPYEGRRLERMDPKANGTLRDHVAGVGQYEDALYVHLSTFSCGLLT